MEQIWQVDEGHCFDSAEAEIFQTEECWKQENLFYKLTQVRE